MSEINYVEYMNGRRMAELKQKCELLKDLLLNDALWTIKDIAKEDDFKNTNLILSTWRGRSSKMVKLYQKYGYDFVELVIKEIINELPEEKDEQ